MKPFILLTLGIFIIFGSCEKDKTYVPSSGATSVFPPDTTKKDSVVILYSRLVFRVKTFRNQNGQILGALFNSSSNYSNNVRFKNFSSALGADSINIVFDSIPAGSYCFSCFHDENSNNKIDKNFFGAPTEGYGFSNNPGITLGAPSYSQIKFQIDSTDTILSNIDLIYL